MGTASALWVSIKGVGQWLCVSCTSLALKNLLLRAQCEARGSRNVSKSRICMSIREELRHPSSLLTFQPLEWEEVVGRAGRRKGPCNCLDPSAPACGREQGASRGEVEGEGNGFGGEGEGRGAHLPAALCSLHPPLPHSIHHAVSLLSSAPFPGLRGSTPVLGSHGVLNPVSTEIYL